MRSFLKTIESKIQNKIGAISFVLAILGFVSSIAVVYFEFSKPLMWFVSTFKYAELNFMKVNFFDLRGGTFLGGFTYNGNALDMAFHFVFLLASILYLYSKKIKKHILQFIYAIIHFSSWVSLVLIIFSQFKRFSLTNLFSISYLISTIILLILSYVILRVLDRDLRSVIKKVQLKEIKEPAFKVATKFKRFSHLIIDTFLLISLTFRMYKILPRDFLNGMVKLIGERYTLTLLFIFGAIIYYVFFEFVFHRTPAKYLTQTFVVTTEKVFLSFNDAFVKSISRKIPLNTFSFIGTNSIGWHDSISKTTVLSFNNNKYNYKNWLLIPALAVLFYLNYQFNEFREDYITYKKQNGILESEVKAIEYGLENLKVNDIISLKNVQGHYYDASHFLKVLKVDGESITLVEIKKTYDLKTLVDINNFHEFNYEDFEEIKVNKDYIRKGVCNHYDFFNGYKACGYKYSKDEWNMRVYAINSPLEPVIYFDRYFKNSTKTVSLDFENFGMISTLNHVEILDGDLEINSTFPKKISGYNNEFSFSFDFTEKIGAFKLLLVFKDDINPNIDYKYTFESDGKFKHSFIKVNTQNSG